MHMPCHTFVDYERADWEKQVAEAPPCAGRAIHFANRCKSKELGLEGYEVDRENVFSNPQEFIDHHSFGKGPQVLIIGKRVITQS
jgi:hypothetical protein